MSSSSKSRGFHPKAALWERSLRRASGRNSPRSSRRLESICRQTCLNKRPSSGTNGKVRLMALIIIFLLLLIVMFGVLIYLLKPTAMEKAVEDQLASIEGGQLSGSRTTILKENAVRSTAVDELART